MVNFLLYLLPNDKEAVVNRSVVNITEPAMRGVVMMVKREVMEAVASWCSLSLSLSHTHSTQTVKFEWTQIY